MRVSCSWLVVPVKEIDYALLGGLDVVCLHDFVAVEVEVGAFRPLFCAEPFELAHSSERHDLWFFAIGLPLVGVDDHGLRTSVRDSWFTGTTVGNDDSEAGTPSPPIALPCRRSHTAA